MNNLYAKLLLVLIALSMASPGILQGDEYEEGLLSLLPASGSIGGWERDGEHLIYYADELWEYINGAAEGFLAYDIKAVVAQDYSGGSGSGLKVEIYDHQTPIMGYGIYSQHRDPSLRFLEVVAEGFGDEYSIQFWKGRYYVKINVYDASDEMNAAMSRFADAVAGSIPGRAAFPHQLGAFPREGLDERSLTYLTEGVLGRGRFPHAFAGDYELEGAAGRLYLFPCENGDQAGALAEWYAGETGAELSEHVKDEAGYRFGSGTDPYQGEVAIFTFGSWAGVVTGFGESPDARRTLVDGAVSGLRDLGLPATPVGPTIEP